VLLAGGNGTRLDPKLVLVLAGDHVYKMDYRPMLEQDYARGAGVTGGRCARRANQSFGSTDSKSNSRSSELMPCGT
jgi:glucose-1-phosphate adenylyltransferase